MSESAAIIKLFFVPCLAQDPSHGYTTSGRSGGQGSAGKQPERRLRGQTRLGLTFRPGPSNKKRLSGMASKRKIPGAGGRSPQNNLPPLQSIHFVSSALPSFPLFRRTHVSALNLCMSLSRWLGVAIIIQPRWASEIAALTRASTKELAAAIPSARDKPPVW
jgi:hypothetical protein